MSSDSTIRHTSEIITEICHVFKDQHNPNNVDLVKLRDYLTKDKSLQESHIFLKKLQEFKNRDSISCQEFSNKFYPNVNNVQIIFIEKDHFDLIFDEIDQDKSGKISKRELELYNKDAELGLTKNDIELMMNFASKDGQKVYKEDLFRFLNSR